MRIFIIMVALLMQQANPAFANTISKEKIDKIFDSFSASFLLEELDTGKRFYYNKKRTSKSFPPCSTFKIFNSLAALDSGVLKNEFEAKKWDGTVYSIKSWNRDQTLQSAFTNSCLWYYQRVAKDIGKEKMQNYLNECDYGNKLIKGKLTRFWLGDSLMISQEQQVEFLKKLVRDELPFSKRSMAITRGLMRAKQTDKGILYGKTGSDMNNNKLVLGWYVGFVSTPSKTYVFATNIAGEDKAWGPKARKLTIKILNEMNLL